LKTWSRRNLDVQPVTPEWWEKWWERRVGGECQPKFNVGAGHLVVLTMIQWKVDAEGD
jgi:hypothetical protein